MFSPANEDNEDDNSKADANFANSRSEAVEALLQNTSEYGEIPHTKGNHNHANTA